jgi:hypothetical protein
VPDAATIPIEAAIKVLDGPAVEVKKALEK